MNFSYKDENGKVFSLDLKIGEKWKEKTFENKALNTIFNIVDNQNGIIEEGELYLLEKLLKKANFSSELGDSGKQITEKELLNLQKQIKDKKIDLEEFEFETLGEFDKEFYSLEAIKQRYSPEKYNIEASDDVIDVVDKETNSSILKVVDTKVSFFVYSKNETEDEISHKIFDGDGKLTTYGKGGSLYNYLAETIYRDVSAKNKFGLPTTSKTFLENIKKIDIYNVASVVTGYRDKFNQPIDEAIREEWGLDEDIKREALKHIEQCLEKNFGYNKQYEKESLRIENKYYRGEEYSIKQKDETLYIKNKNTNEEYCIDIQKMTENLPVYDRVKTKLILQKLPGDVLADLVVEIKKGFLTNDDYWGRIEDWMRIKAYGFDTPKVGGFYTYKDNRITIGRPEANVLAHELAHSLDYMGPDNESSIKKNQEFMATFKEEMDEYLAKGNKTFDETHNPKLYATCDEQEMFAECYALLMTSYCISKEIIEEHFSRTLDSAKKHIEYIRSLPREERISND